MKKTVTFGLLFVLILASCSIFIEKRRYNKGLHVEIGRNRLSSDKKDTQKDIRNAEDITSFYPKKSGSVKSEEKAEEKPVEVKVFKDKRHEQESPAIQTKVKTGVQTTAYVDQKSGSSQSEKKHTIDKNVDYTTRSIHERENGDAYIYGLGAMLTLLGFGAIRLNRNTSLKCSRFAHNNPYLSKGLITLGYSSLGALGYLTGAELYHMGTDVSDMTQYVLGTTMVITGASVHYYEKRSSITVWNSFYKRKLGHLIIGACMFGSLISIGNGMQENKPQYSPVGYIISAVQPSDKDQVEHVSDTMSMDSTEKMSVPGNGGLVALYIFLAVIVIILTVIFTCVAACNDMAFLAVAIIIMGVALTVFLCTLAANSRTKGD